MIEVLDGQIIGNIMNGRNYREETFCICIFLT